MLRRFRHKLIERREFKRKSVYSRLIHLLMLKTLRLSTKTILLMLNICEQITVYVFHPD